MPGRLRLDPERAWVGRVQIARGLRCDLVESSSSRSRDTRAGSSVCCRIESFILAQNIDTADYVVELWSVYRILRELRHVLESLVADLLDRRALIWIICLYRRVS